MNENRSNLELALTALMAIRELEKRGNIFPAASAELHEFSGRIVGLRRRADAMLAREAMRDADSGEAAS